MSAINPSNADAAIREAAARWIVRRDRGLSATESIEYELWLAADPRHAQAMQRAGGAWALLDRIPEDVAQQTLAAATRRRSYWRRGLLGGSLAAAASAAFLIHGSWPRIAEAPVSRPPTSLHAAGPSVVTLADGSTVRLNTGGEVVEQFTAAERRVLLARGEAHFLVVKDAARPFVVNAGTLRVRAVGTAFNVNLQSAQVEVIVTEGRVAVATTEGEGRTPEAGGQRSEARGRTPEVRGQRSEVDVPRRSSSAGGRSEDRNQKSEVGGRRSEIGGQLAASEPLHGLIAELGAGERAVISTPPRGTAEISPAVVVTRIDAAEMSRTLAWQDELIRLGGATLAEIAANFERRTGRRVILADPALAGLRLGGRFRADDIDGFANLLATTLEIDVERAADGTLVLRKKK